MPEPKIRYVSINVLKPQKPDIVELAKKLVELPNIMCCHIEVTEITHAIQSVKIMLEGYEISLGDVEELLLKSGASIQAVEKIMMCKS